MNLELELALLCERMVDLLKELREKSQITEEEYIEHTKLKIKFLQRNLLEAK
ncbi:MAG: hypothetical protein GX300_08155 [Tissierellia bacterium]|nr:hypothetical protein [Tissierellia bacterium]